MDELLKKLEDRAAKLQHDMKALCTPDGGLDSENRSKFENMQAALAEVEGSIAEVKDAQLEEMRSRLAAAERTATPETDKEEVAFRSFLRAGLDRMDVEERASLIAGTDANGGFIVPENMHAQLIEPYRLVNPIMDLSTTFNLTGSSSIELPFKATNGAVASAGETDTRTEQNAPTFGNNTLTAYDLYTDQRATQLFLDEVAGSEQMLMGWIYADILEQAEQNAAIGNGTNKATGLFTATSVYGIDNVATAGKIAAGDVLDMYFALGAGYRGNGTWLCSSATLAELAKLSHPADAHTPLLDMKGSTFTMLGREVRETESAPNVGAGTYPLAFGDIKKGYATAVHKNTVILRDPYTATPKVRFYAVARIGGRPWDANAVRLLSTAVAEG